MRIDMYLLSRLVGCIVIVITLLNATAIAKNTVSQSKAEASRHKNEDLDVTPSAFHLVFNGQPDGDKPGVLMDVIVNPEKRSITGVIEVTGAKHLHAHISGYYREDGPSITARLVGYRQFLSECLGPPRPYAFKTNTKVDLVVDQGWRSGSATMSYSFDRDAAQGTWERAEHISLVGSDPLHWRNVYTMDWGGDEPIASDGNGCSFSDAKERNRLSELGDDSSRLMLTFSEKKKQYNTSWAVKNNTTRHLLAEVVCASHDGEQAEATSDVILLHPLELRPLYDFGNEAQETCIVSRAHFDD